MTSAATRNRSKGAKEHPYRARPKAKTHEWLTPPWIFRALGQFNLDPCAHPARPSHTLALHSITPPDDGLSAKWSGRVWLNPPFGDHTKLWLKKLADHGDGIALVFARTDTAMFHDDVFGRASALLFLKGRPKFIRPDGTEAKGNSGGPIMLIAYGRQNARYLRWCGLPGAYVSAAKRITPIKQRGRKK